MLPASWQATFIMKDLVAIRGLLRYKAKRNGYKLSPVEMKRLQIVSS